MAGRQALLPQIEAIRVMAMTVILVYHLSSALPEPFGETALRTLNLGWLGVVVFNVITGLVLALPHLGPGQSPPLPYSTFLRRRFLRILPNYVIALLLFTAAAAVQAGPSVALAESFLGHLLLVHSLSPAWFFDIVPAYWWLGLQAQFILAFPLVLALFMAAGPGRGLMAVCAACWGGWAALAAAAACYPESALPFLNYMAYYNLPARLPEFAIGMWLASALVLAEAPAETRLRLPSPLSSLAVPAALVVLPGGLLLPPDAMPWSHLWQTAWGAGLFVVLLTLPAVARMGRNIVVARLAAASYSFYLLHQPILGWGAAWLREAGLGPLPAVAVLLPTTTAVTIGLSLALDRLVAVLMDRGKASPHKSQGQPLS